MEEEEGGGDGGKEVKQNSARMVQGGEGGGGGGGPYLAFNLLCYVVPQTITVGDLLAPGQEGHSCRLVCDDELTPDARFALGIESRAEGP